MEAASIARAATRHDKAYASALRQIHSILLSSNNPVSNLSGAEGAINIQQVVGVIESGLCSSTCCHIPLTSTPNILFFERQLQHIYARHLGGKKDGNTCESMFEPDVGEVVVLVR